MNVEPAPPIDTPLTHSRARSTSHFVATQSTNASSRLGVKSRVTPSVHGRHVPMFSW